MEWKGSGNTDCENAVLASASLAQPSTNNRKSRFHPTGSSGRPAARKRNCTSSPEPFQRMPQKFVPRPCVLEKPWSIQPNGCTPIKKQSYIRDEPVSALGSGKMAV